MTHFEMRTLWIEEHGPIRQGGRLEEERSECGETRDTTGSGFGRKLDTVGYAAIE